jgi:hypothetical protein
MSKTIKQRFGEVVLGENHNKDCEKILDEVSCGFGNWLFRNQNTNKVFFYNEIDRKHIRLPMIDLLKIYKKEQGL